MTIRGDREADVWLSDEQLAKLTRADEAELYEREAHARNGPPADLFVLDDQLHVVRSSMAGPQFFRAYAQGPTAAATSVFKSNPFRPAGAFDELGKTWQVLNPQVVG